MGDPALRLRAVLAVYGTALIAGLSVVSFAASAAVLKASLHLSDSEYGGIFLPQVVCTILGSLAGGALSTRVSPRAILQGALGAFAAAEASLYGCTVVGPSLAYVVLLAATGFMGAGFGLSAAPLNTLPRAPLSGARQTALVALHTAIGAGFALGPVLLARITLLASWGAAPIGLSVASLFAVGLVGLAGLPGRTVATTSVVELPLPYRKLSAYFVIGVLYAFAEGTFANWSIVFLNEERGIDAGSAALALACFWAAVAGGRLAVSALLVRVPARRVWLALPVAMMLASLLVPAASTALAGIFVFALAGVACSAFFPLTVSAAVSVEPSRGNEIASAMTAALMFGVGLGSFTVGPLRAALTIAQIYHYSALYSVGALCLALTTNRRERAVPAAITFDET